MRRLLIVPAVLVPLAVVAIAVPGLDRGDPKPRTAGGTVASTPNPSPSNGTSAPAAEPPGGPPAFRGTVSVIDSATRARMSSSWRAGCPVSLESLRLLRLSHWGFDGVAQEGEMVVHADVAADVVTVFRELYRVRFPIRRMELVDVYGGDDGRSMAANNTSGFNCRYKTGSRTSWSEHSYGRAIDINPIQNPYVSGGSVEPAAGSRYTDRSVAAQGMIHAGDPVVKAFAAIGWGWGGTWSSIKDYQHFSRSGR